MRSEVNGYIPCFAIALPFSCCHFVFTALPFFRRRTCMAHHKTSQKFGVGREAGRESFGKQSNEIWRSFRKTFFNSIYWEVFGGKIVLENFSVKYFFRFCFSFICTYGKSFFSFPLSSTPQWSQLKIEKVGYEAFMNMQANVWKSQ